MSRSRIQEEGEEQDQYSDNVEFTNNNQSHPNGVAVGDGVANQHHSFFDSIPQDTTQFLPQNGQMSSSSHQSEFYQQQDQDQDQDENGERVGSPAFSSSSSLPSPPSTPIMNADLSLEEFQRDFWSYHMKLVEKAPLAPTTSTPNPSSNQSSNPSASDQLDPNVNNSNGSKSKASAKSTSRKHTNESFPEGVDDGNDKDWEEIEVKKQERLQKKWKGKTLNFKPGPGQLPLARIKKVMKLDEEVEMISAEAPMLFARASEIFIADLTARAFMSANNSKRRTIQRIDIAAAIGTSELFDFLVDIIPREEMDLIPKRSRGGSSNKQPKSSSRSGSVSRASSVQNHHEDNHARQNSSHLPVDHKGKGKATEQDYTFHNGGYDSSREDGSSYQQTNDQSHHQDQYYPALHIPSS